MQEIIEKTEYLCPGCLFIGKNTTLSLYKKTFECQNCLIEFNKANDLPWINFFKTFKIHNKLGFRCPDCKNFIPEPWNQEEIVCPYIKCCFIGNKNSLKRMHHPTSSSKKKKIENYINVVSSSIILNDQSKKILNVLDNLLNEFYFEEQTLLTCLRIKICQSFKNLLLQNSDKMTDYLINNSRSGGFQHKLFQEFTNLVETSLPLFYKEKKNQFKIESLLDEKLGLFEGISIFEGIVTDKSVIKNNTQEFYVGGREGFYHQPYYIGKLLDVIDKKTNQSLLNQVQEYSFSQIKTNIKPNTEIIVKHLRIPPHYQMGGMTYINRMRKEIIERYEKEN